jgi:uncharacterized protein YdcH (DUF465 family)
MRRVIRLDYHQEESLMHPRLYRLIETHRRIDDALRNEQQRPAANWQRVQSLKKLKLRVKDLAVCLMRRARPIRAS